MTAENFPLIPTVRAAYRDVFGDLKAFFKVTWLMWVLMLLFIEVPMGMVIKKIQEDIAPVATTAPQAEADVSKVPAPAASDKASDKTEDNAEAMASRIAPQSIMYVMAINTAQALLIMFFVTAWFRALLLHERRGATIVPRLGATQWYFVWTSMKTALIMSPLSMFAFFQFAGIASGANGGTEQVVAASLSTLGLLYVYARFILAYPLSAIGQHEEPVRQSWDMTKGHGLRIMLGNFLVFFPMMLGMILFSFILGMLIDGWQGAPAPESHDAITHSDPLAVRIFVALVKSYFYIMFFGVLSAFHARIYATLARAPAAAG